MTGKGGDQAEEGNRPILCLLHCLSVLSLPLSSYLAILPLTSSQRPFTFFIAFVVLPPSLDPYSFSLFWQASTQIWWPLLFSSTYHVLPFSGSTFASTSTICCSSFPLSDFTLIPACLLCQNGKTRLGFVRRFKRKYETTRVCK